jgi:hypothetical protein
MRKFYLLSLLLLAGYFGFGQCNILSNALTGITLHYQSTNLFNCSGVAYNPIRNVYYGVRAGNPSFPLETWTNVGGQLYTTSAGFDWRGMWWNPNTNQLEGNGYSTYGMWRSDLNASGWALNTGIYLFSGQSQPDAQSCGDYDPVANEVIYYYNGSIYRYSRASNALLGSYPLLGVPTALGNINWTTVMFTGCAGKEIAILDVPLKRVYLFQKNTGAYVGMSQLPASAVTTNGFRLSYANGYVWLFDLGTGNWVSYQIFDLILSESNLACQANWSSPSTIQVDWQSESFQGFNSFVIERSLDGTDFLPVGDALPEQFLREADGKRFWNIQDMAAPQAPVLYYRVKGMDMAGNVHTSNVAAIQAGQAQLMAMQAWPVPANQMLNVSFAAAKAGDILEVWDAAAKSIYRQELTTADVQQARIHLSCQNWANGMYTLRLKDLSNGTQSSLRVAIQQ